MPASPFATFIWNRDSPGDFVSLNTVELHGAQFHQKLKDFGNGYIYPEHHHNRQGQEHHHHRQDQNQLSKELQDAKYVLVRVV